MNKKELKPGTKIVVSLPNNKWYDGIVTYYHDEYGHNTLTGTIIDKPGNPANKGKVWVAWDKSDHYSEGEENELDISILTLESDKSNIEQEFKLFSKDIKDKMKEAAKLVLEANELATKAHASSLADMWEEVSPLVNAMDNSGWNSSSWGC